MATRRSCCSRSSASARVSRSGAPGMDCRPCLRSPRRSNRRGWYAMMGQLGAPVGFMLASGLYLLLYATLSQEDFLSWGWRYPFFCAFAINVVALFARLRLVVTDEFDQLLTEQGARSPTPAAKCCGSQGYNVILGAFGALASYALFHVVTVFPLSWIMLFSKQSVTAFLAIQILAAMSGDMRRRRLRRDRRPDRPAQDARLVCRADRRLQRLRADAARRRHAGTGRVRPDRVRVARALLRAGGRRAQCELRAEISATPARRSPPTSPG